MTVVSLLPAAATAPKRAVLAERRLVALVTMTRGYANSFQKTLLLYRL